MSHRSIADIRRDYGVLNLDEQHIHENPIEQFKIWFAEVLAEEPHDPTAMVLSTVDEQGFPDSRVVLLKGLEENSFIFYTNYHSAKGIQLAHEPRAALNFYWPHMARQVRIRGRVEKISAERSDDYFFSRPLSSQLSAIVSPQSKDIKDRAFLEQALEQLATEGQAPITRPLHWGGYSLTPESIEFWQGRDNRLHDRIAYCRQNNTWSHSRLAP
ncbi:pyridoxamine 5'-phosphate oxidase [Legionella sp. km772]|uniref:pyridoxamine 5'-phosphate oxidase n=1 Tax=Legionella sp. km772 TaxID=2498111 RepID=UPI0026A17A31